MYCLAKVHKIFAYDLRSFRPISSVNSTPTYKLAKVLAPMLKTLKINEYTIKDSFTFAKELQRFDSKFVMASLIQNYKQHDGVVLSSPLRPTLANDFFLLLLLS